MTEQRIASGPAKDLFARIGKEATLVGRHLDELLLAYGTGREIKILTELGLAQKHHRYVIEALGLLAAGKVIEAEAMFAELDKTKP